MMIKLKYAVSGAIAVVGIALLIGFTWGGWYSAGGAQKLAQETADAAVIKALVPVCAAEYVKTATDADKADFMKAASYSQNDAVEKLVKLPGMKSMSYDLRRGCAESAVKLLTASAAAKQG